MPPTAKELFEADYQKYLQERATKLEVQGK
jgi:hypothetical protein